MGVSTVDASYLLNKPAGVSTTQHATFHSLNSYFSCVCGVFSLYVCVCIHVCICVCV